MSTDETPDVRNQIWGAADPSGATRALIDAANHESAQSPAWLRVLGHDVNRALERLVDAGLEYRRGIEAIEAAVRLLVPRGWAVTNMDKALVQRAVHLAESGDGDGADRLLAEQWEGDSAWRLSRVCSRVRVMGGADPELKHLFVERARLLSLARDHHLEARYDASIPILQAQLEGIAVDVTGGLKFFTKRATQKADLVEPKRLASIEACLAALQATYGQDVNVTQAKGALSRHGVAHGRELAYDTRENSAKTWSVMDALVEWALPKARDVVAARKAERQARNAGSQETDESRRRVDDREFSETRDVLRLLETSAIGWYRREGGFRSNLVGDVYQVDDLTRRGLPADHGIVEQVRADGQEVMYWRRTASGWVLGLAMTAVQGDFEERLYSQAQPPAGLPTDGAQGWHSVYETPPDWA